MCHLPLVTRRVQIERASLSLKNSSRVIPRRVQMGSLHALYSRSHGSYPPTLHFRKVERETKLRTYDTRIAGVRFMGDRVYSAGCPRTGCPKEEGRGGGLLRRAAVLNAANGAQSIIYTGR